MDKLTRSELKMIQCMTELNQKEFAARIGYTPEHISEILRGKQPVPKHIGAVLLAHFPAQTKIVISYKETKSD